jgi:multidrug efflux system outer membrane protein
MRRLIASSFLVIILVGCAIGPNYRRPEIESPPAWRFEEKEAKEVANIAWWEQFQDLVLDDLIKASLQENKDLRIATARVEEFYGQYGATRANLFPQVGYDASGSKQRVTENGFIPVPPGVSPKFNTFQAEFSASWELDIWGKLRRATEAARADLLSTEESRQGVILSLVSSVAAAYIDLRSLDRQLEISKSTAKSREESVDIFKRRFSAGTVSELELSQAQSEYFAALAQVPALEKSVAQLENALSVLIGRNPGPIPRGKTIDELAVPAVPAGLPSDLLERRPDIRQAEQQLIAANARIGVAKGLYFPSISLTGFFGSSSKELSDLFKGPSRAWSYTGTLAGPIFTAGKIKGQVRAAEAIQQEALFSYQKVIQSGFQEVEDALVDQGRTRAQLDVQKKQVEALRTYARLARHRYDNGYTSYIEVLDAERSLFNGEISYTQTQDVLFRAFVNLYKAMGGGWVVEADRMATIPPK